MHLRNKLFICDKLSQTNNSIVCEERKARGISILNHNQCKGLLKYVQPKNSNEDTSDTKLVGFILPMLLQSSEAYRHESDLLNAVKKAVEDYDGYEVNIYDAQFRKNEDYESSSLYFYHHVWCKTFIYCKYPGISELRKYLNELSPVLLRDEAEVSWGVASEQDGRESV